MSIGGAAAGIAPAEAGTGRLPLVEGAGLAAALGASVALRPRPGAR